jgi:hypothetical protein
MKTIRNLAGVLLLITGILHIVMYAQTPDKPGIMGVLAFGILYSITGLLLFSKLRFALYLGLFVPLVGMTLSIIKFGIPELFSMLALFKLIGLLVVISCFYLLVKQK